MRILVLKQRGPQCKRLTTNVALEWTIPGMNASVDFQVGGARVRLPALLTLKSSGTRVHDFMVLELSSPFESLVTLLTGKWSVPCVHYRMSLQIAALGKGLSTLVALEGLLT